MLRKLKLVMFNSRVIVFGFIDFVYLVYNCNINMLFEYCILWDMSFLWLYFKVVLIIMMMVVCFV